MKYNIWEKLLIKLFVDNLILAKYWRCHHKFERSFFVKGRQFHLCARCTGIVTGYYFSPFFWLIARENTVICFITFTLIMALDGFTQLWNLRTSTNPLRFITGLGFGLTFPAFCIETLLKIFNLFI